MHTLKGLAKGYSASSGCMDFCARHPVIPWHNVTAKLTTSLLVRIRWVQEQLRDHGGDMWISGAEDYAKHARDLLSDFADVISRRSVPAAAGDAVAAEAPVPTAGQQLPAQCKLLQRAQM